MTDKEIKSEDTKSRIEILRKAFEFKGFAPKPFYSASGIVGLRFAVADLETLAAMLDK